MKPSFPLRDYQDTASDRILEEFFKVNSTLLVLCTGGGKTIIFSDIIRRMHPQRVIVLAHREELIFQAKEKIEMVTGLSCEIEMADMVAGATLFTQAHVIISTIQTQCSGPTGKERMTRFKPEDFGLLVIDEAHHAAAKSYRKIIDYYRQNPCLKVLGVTATPDRADSLALGEIFESVAFDYEIIDAIHNGYLVPIDQQFVKVHDLDFSKVRTTAGDLNGGDLAALMEQEKNMQEVAAASLQIIGDKRTLIFTASVKQAETLAAILNRHRDGMADWVCGKTDKESRRLLLKAFSTGTKQVMVNCGVLTEGYDNPFVEIVIMARPTKSRSLYSQMVGRGTRALPGVFDGLPTADERKAAIAASAKPSLLVVDFCIAEGQRILTNAGLVPIEQVTLEMKVWDGVDFVAHCGIIFRGERNTIEYEGLKATPDHRVWTKEGWKTFGECAREQTPIAVTGFGNEEIRQADGCYRGHNPNGSSKEFSLCPDSLRLRRSGLEGVHEFNFRKSWLSKVRLSKKLPEMAIRTLLECAATMSESVERTVQILRWSRNKIHVLNCVGHGFLDSGQLGTAPAFKLGQDQSKRELRTRKYSICRQVDSNVQPTKKETTPLHHLARFQTATPRDQIRGFHPSEDVGRDERAGHREKILRAFPETKRNTWDILNCGPRHRFTVEGLLVANCGNSGRHKLMTSADILGGKASEEAIEIAKEKAKKNGSQVRMSDLLDESEEEIQKERERRRLELAARNARVIAEAKFTSIAVNPFERYNVRFEKANSWDRTQGRVLSEKQRFALKKGGVDPDSISYSCARKMLGAICNPNNPASEGQIKVLRKFGYPTDMVSKNDASKIIQAIADNGWQRPLTPAGRSTEPEPIQEPMPEPVYEPDAHELFENV